MTTINKILIANRGEIALRIIQTCREMGIRTVAVYSTADENSLHVKFADEAVCIGGPSSIDSYLNIPRIISAVEITNAQAIHPGYGYLSENYRFAQICIENDIIFIGPKANTINAMGNKLSAILQMKALGVPTIPGSYAVLNDLNCAIEVANNIGYPVLLKAVSGGGGKGIVAVYNQEDLQSAWDKAKREALVSFASDDLYMEKYITNNVRHIEVQVLADQYGTIIPFVERDCSIQRRNQKLIEETPSPFISQQLRETLLKTTKESLTKIGYLNSGTVEYLVDDQENYYFMEMNTRLQVEHTITEMIHNVNIVKNQIEIAEGYRLSDIMYNGTCALECRINAEDPENDFKPSCGTITTLHIPTGFGVRVDTHIYTDYQITPYYDSLLAKVITFGNTHDECVARMKRALDEFIIEGIKTTIQYCKSLL